VRLGIYNQPAEGGIGGSEISVAVLAEALACDNRVDIVHHKPYMTRERIAEISGADLSEVRMRPVVEEPYSCGSSHNPLRRYIEARKWQKALSEPYDLFINFTHGFPPFCHARNGALVVLFPFHRPPHSCPCEASPNNGARFRNRVSCAYHEWEWRKRLSTYGIKTTISHFSRIWTTRRWGVDCDVIYPPVDTSGPVCEKENVILSVGRFTATGRSKKQLEMLAAFHQLQKAAVPGWDYICVGGVSDASPDQEYFQRAGQLVRDCRAKVLGNLERTRLKRIYAQARIFWHAAGFGECGERPELSEHFGIATVEAMSAGCVPVVVNKGGQQEIVEHGVSGFLWNSLEELRQYTELLMRDEQLRARMEAAARARAAQFSRERFLSRFLVLLGEEFQ
jgi:glycosyltransferase involved in cell wall biosynthesis